MGKGMKIMVTSLVILLIIVITALVIVLTVSDSGDSSGDSEPSISEMVSNSFDTEEVTTDLQDGSFVRMQFRVITDSEAALEEVSQRDFQITNILIKELSKMTTADFTSDLDGLEAALQTRLNELMTEGEVTDVYTIMKILQ